MECQDSSRRACFDFWFAIVRPSSLALCSFLCVGLSACAHTEAARPEDHFADEYAVVVEGLSDNPSEGLDCIEECSADEVIPACEDACFSERFPAYGRCPGEQMAWPGTQ